MKRFLALTLILFLAISFAGCEKTAPAETPSTRVMLGSVTEIENGAMLVTPIEGSWERDSSDCFSIPVMHMASSPEPTVGDMIEILYNGDICETYPATLGKIISIRIEPRAQLICIDGVTYCNTGKTVQAEPDESIIEYAEIPAGGNAVITAFARTDGSNTIACLMNGEWYEFRAADAAAAGTEDAGHSGRTE